MGHCKTISAASASTGATAMSHCNTISAAIVRPRSS